jgi:hypothetical protein
MFLSPSQREDKLKPGHRNIQALTLRRQAAGCNPDYRMRSGQRVTSAN